MLRLGARQTPAQTCLKSRGPPCLLLQGQQTCLFPFKPGRTQSGAPRGLCQPNHTGPCPRGYMVPSTPRASSCSPPATQGGPTLTSQGRLSLTKPYGIEPPEPEAQLKGFTVTALPQNPGPPAGCSHVPRTGAETASPPHSAAVTTHPPGRTDSPSPKTQWLPEGTGLLP